MSGDPMPENVGPKVKDMEIETTEYPPEAEMQLKQAASPGKVEREDFKITEVTSDEVSVAEVFSGAVRYSNVVVNSFGKRQRSVTIFGSVPIRDGAVPMRNHDLHIRKADRSHNKPPPDGMLRLFKSRAKRSLFSLAEYAGAETDPRSKIFKECCELVPVYRGMDTRTFKYLRGAAKYKAKLASKEWKKGKKKFLKLKALAAKEMMHDHV